MKSKTLHPSDTGYHIGHLPNSPEVQRAREIAQQRRHHDFSFIPTTLRVPAGHFVSQLLEIIEHGGLDYTSSDGLFIRPFQRGPTEDTVTRFLQLKGAICEHFRISDMDSGMHPKILEIAIDQLHSKFFSSEEALCRVHEEEVRERASSHFIFSVKEEKVWKVGDIFDLIGTFPDISPEQKVTFREDVLSRVYLRMTDWEDDLFVEERPNIVLDHEGMKDFIEGIVEHLHSRPEWERKGEFMKGIHKKIMALVEVPEEMIRRFSGGDGRGDRERIARCA